MSSNHARVIVRWVLSLAIIFFANGALADSYPSGPVTLIVPYAPGGATDSLGRLVAQQLTNEWGRPVVVVNKPGANGIIGAGLVARSKPDGLTILLVVPGHLINPSLYSHLSYDVLQDFTPITEVATSPWLVAVNKSVPASNLQELIALAKEQPGKISFGSSEPSTWLAGKLFEQKAEISLLSVPYKGASQVMVDLLGEQIQVAFTTSLSIGELYSADKLRVLAVASQKRLAAMPEIPTSAEAGLPGYEAGAWYGLYGPAGLPKEVVAKIQQSIATILSREQVRAQLRAMGADTIGSKPEDFAAFSRDEFMKYAKLVKDANIKPQ
jgi:tripartite-type tricarboxylate transporter receptor subunit TctC